MLFISSTTQGQTSAAELCPVFKSLLFKNALRLDGGPSTSLVISGKLLNKLEGVDRLKYGESRRVAYPLVVGY
jgi:exopolysaccharide biosynthesis protein